MGDDIEVYNDEKRKNVVAHFLTLRQQVKKSGGIPNIALSDFIAPKNSEIDDYIGAFAVTAGINAKESSEEYEKENDDYNAIMVKTIADRLAEAFAELMHQRVRKEWGFPDKSGITNQDLLKEKYRGIRPAFGYPACPTHEEKVKLFRILDADKIEVRLTENYAMTPAASVSGLYFANKKSRYFSI